jgi:hypothetical protein
MRVCRVSLLGIQSISKIIIKIELLELELELGFGLLAN